MEEAGAVFITVLSGTLVYVLGKLIEEFLIKPVISLREALGRLSHFLLSNQAQLTNATLTEENGVELKRLGAEVRSKHQTVILQRVAAQAKLIPKREDLITACGEINLIAYKSVYRLQPGENSNKSPGMAVYELLLQIEKLLRIRATYGS